MIQYIQSYTVIEVHRYRGYRGYRCNNSYGMDPYLGTNSSLEGGGQLFVSNILLDFTKVTSTDRSSWEWVRVRVW
jgi:hypothetical protein